MVFLTSGFSVVQIIEFQMPLKFSIGKMISDNTGYDDYQWR